MRRKSLIVVIAAFVIVGASFSFGVWYGYQARPEMTRIIGVLNKSAPEAESVDFEPFWKAWRLMESMYVGDEPVKRQALVWGAISGMVRSFGDPYSTFFPPKDLQDFQTEIKGEFSGIGAEIGMRKEILTIIAPIKGSPADKAGLKAGDKILKIDETFTNDLSLDEAVHKIRGERGTKVTLTILRANQDKPQIIDVVRDTIKVPILDTEIKDGIFVIRLASFSEQSGPEFGDAVRKFLNSGSKKLVLDLRSNPGGFFSSAVDIASWFLPEGEVVAQEEYRDEKPELFRSIGYRALENVTTVVLIDRGTASAAEILAGALQEHGKAVLMGEKTFGKGSVQQLESITPDTSLKITIAKWLTPNGKSISKEGLAPDIEVKTPEDIKPGEDPVLDKALIYLKSR